MKNIFILFFVFALSVSVVSAQPVIVQYFHQEGCPDCEITDSIIDNIEMQYSNITIQRFETDTFEGYDQWSKYGFVEVPAIVINNQTKVPKEKISEERIKRLIDEYLHPENNADDRSNLNVSLEEDKTKEGYIDTNLNYPLAYLFGFFSGMSPCLMAILGFLLSFTAGTSESVRNGMAKATVFGVGLVTSYLAIGIGLIIFKRTIPNIEIFSLITGVVVIVIGLHLMGFFKLPITMENYFHNTARKHAGTIGGLFFLGVLFSLVKVPCTLPMLLVLLDKTVSQGTLGDLSLLLVFSLGVLTPFIGVGLIGGYTLTKHIREYRGHVKLISGIVLVLLGLWILVL